MQNSHYSGNIFKQTRIFSTGSRQANAKFYENPTSVNRVVPCGRTDSRDETKSRFSQFCEGA
jgi:hypothetical protein